MITSGPLADTVPKSKNILFSSSLRVAEDVPSWGFALVGCFVALSLFFLTLEFGAFRQLGQKKNRGEKGENKETIRLWILSVCSLFFLVVAIFRPAIVTVEKEKENARVLLLEDRSRSMFLPNRSSSPSSRLQESDSAISRWKEKAGAISLHIEHFGDSPSMRPESDLEEALFAYLNKNNEPLSAVIVVSDGRLSAPNAELGTNQIEAMVSKWRQNTASESPKKVSPIYTVGIGESNPKDLSIRSVTAPHAGVAHVPMSLRVELGSEGLDVSESRVSVNEIREDGSKKNIGSTLLKLNQGKAIGELSITLDRAGDQLLEVSTEILQGDEIPENNTRYFKIYVTRERIRLLHIAGRATLDVRALRDWLKANNSIDLISFFILRTILDHPMASNDELALIPFPVNELFEEHLPSFDAVILQDFDARPYGLEAHLPRLTRYVRDGGGLVMIGGPGSFSTGGYADSQLAEALPTELEKTSTLIHQEKLESATIDLPTFRPEWTNFGRKAPMLAAFRDLVSENLPDVPGANVLGDAKTSAHVLLVHPTHKTPKGNPMPVLATRDFGAGRTIALGVDGTWRLQFSSFGSKNNGLGYSALWDGLLGWLMHEPRYEDAHIELEHDCSPFFPTHFQVTTPELAGQAALQIQVTRLDQKGQALKAHLKEQNQASFRSEFPPLAPGLYQAQLLSNEDSLTRYTFFCSSGSEEWADSRLDHRWLSGISKATGGSFVLSHEMDNIPLPPPTETMLAQHLSPLAPPWLWSFLAIFSLGATWYERRRIGLT